MTSHPLYLCHHTHSIDDITATTWKYYIQYICDIISPMFLTKYLQSVTSQHSVLMSPHSHMCDILCTADDLAYTLSHQTTVFMISHPLQASHNTPCIRHCTPCKFVITTSPLISHQLLNDITPTFCVTYYSL